jgi:hypothetical protein
VPKDGENRGFRDGSLSQKLGKMSVKGTLREVVKIETGKGTRKFLSDRLHVVASDRLADQMFEK